MALLENIRVFARVVELGSLSAAGRHLRLSPAVVSHRLQQLERHLGVDDGDVLTEWALLGEGIVMKSLWEVAEHLRAGRLRSVLPDCPPEPATLAVIYPHRQLLPARVKAFADFIIDQGGKALAAAGTAADV